MLIDPVNIIIFAGALFFFIASIMIVKDDLLFSIFAMVPVALLVLILCLRVSWNIDHNNAVRDLKTEGYLATHVSPKNGTVMLNYPGCPPISVILKKSQGVYLPFITKSVIIQGVGTTIVNVKASAHGECNLR